MAASSPAPPRTVQFGGFELDLARAELRKGGAVESLPPQPLRVLVLLASRAGDLVTRETIRQELWGEDVSVDFDHGLNTCIRQIRAVLGDEARSWRFIETVQFLEGVTSLIEHFGEVRLEGHCLVVARKRPIEIL